MAAIGEEEGHQLTQFTDLPDEILIRILSLLPTVDAVRTCLGVLRGSGKHHLLKSLTRLEFHEFYMLLYGSRFRNFVNRVMDLRDHSVPLDSFSLQYDLEEEEEEEEDANRIKTWITKAVQCNVEELTFSIQERRQRQTRHIAASFDARITNTPYFCIFGLFGCQSLVKLVLEMITFTVPTSVISLPRLKYLRLRHVNFYVDKSIERLLSSPLLEELIIDGCSWGRIESIRVCSPKLQILKIYDTYSHEYHHSSTICIVGDNLKSFFYMGDLINGYRIRASSSSSMQLSKVEISVNKKMPKGAAPNCYEILKGLSGTRNLTLSDHFLQGLESSSELLDTIPIFQALTQLNIRVYEAICIDSSVLMNLYEKCPDLDYLTIEKLSLAVRRPRLRPIPICFLFHLKKILVHYYVPGDEADAAIDVLLNSAIILEELVIYWDEKKGGCEIQELQGRLNRRPRVSRDCIISVRVI